MMVGNPICPECGSSMVLRTAKKGKFAGSQFYGCSRYPACKGILNLDEVGQAYPQVSRPNPSTIIQPNPESEFADLTVDKKEDYQIPRRVNLQNATNRYNVKLFQSVGSIEKIINIAYLYKGNISKFAIQSFSQWRLDTPKVNSPASSTIRNVVGIAKKILERGSLVFCTREIENSFLRYASPLRLDPDSWIKVINSNHTFPRNGYATTEFESKEEEVFYNKYLAKLNLTNWTIAQFPISTLVDSETEKGTEKRVDFFISYPGQKGIVVEIDGPQHKNHVIADDLRDNLLKNNDIEVYRVPTKEIQNGTGSGLNHLLSRLSQLPVVKKTSLSKAEVAFLVAKYCTQIQISILEAINNGHLPLTGIRKFSIFAEKPHYLDQDSAWADFLTSALKDVETMLADLGQLYGMPSLKISLTSSSRYSRNDLSILLLNSPKDVKRSSKAEYQIADIFLPFDLMEPIGKSVPIFAKNPEKSVCEYFLHLIFRKEGFLEGQWEAVERAVAGKDAILLMVTGGGKSIAFQLAAFLLPGSCIVVAPIIALIEDQVQNLLRYGVDRAVGISSNLSRQSKNEALDAFSAGHYIFCYLSPERFQIENFRQALAAFVQEGSIGLIAIDEAHCISEWGHDFRVAYLNIGRNTREHCASHDTIPPLLGLTGTASRSVLRDIQRELQINDSEAIIKTRDFDRKNLHFNILSCSSEEKSGLLETWLEEIPHELSKPKTGFYFPNGELTNSGIVFFPHVNGDFGTTTGYKLLKKNAGEVVGIYSGKAPKGFDEKNWDLLKKNTAEKFRRNEVCILAATKAFGMGIDKPNIRFTIHYNLPPSIEAFYQEAGRAGRDLQPSVCAVIMSNDDPDRTRRLLDPTTDVSEVIDTVTNASWDESDDIVRSLFFHVNSFKGIDSEIREIENVLDQLGELGRKKKNEIPYKAESRKTPVERALHRLVVLGVLQDYVVNYASRTFILETSSKSQEQYIESYAEYISNYDYKRAETARKEMREHLYLDRRAFIMVLATSLVRNFIYGVIEQSRRRSLATMLEAATDIRGQSGLRERMLSYLALGKHSEILESIQRDHTRARTIISELKEDIRSPKDGAELRGESSRMLESYPTNPGLLLSRAFAETTVADPKPEVILDNFNAYFNFALSKEGWNLDVSEINSPTNEFLSHLYEMDSNVARQAFERVIDNYVGSIEMTREGIEELPVEFSLFLTNTLRSKLRKSLGELLDQEER